MISIWCRIDNVCAQFLGTTQQITTSIEFLSEAKQKTILQLKYSAK